jgi:hypothetical protein
VQALTLPASPSILAILDEYTKAPSRHVSMYAYTRTQRSSSLRAEQSLRLCRTDKEQACAGILAVFRHVIGTRLLYDVERPLHTAYVAEHPETDVAAAYGRNHLLRLLGQSVHSIFIFSSLADHEIVPCTAVLPSWLNELGREPVVRDQMTDASIAMLNALVDDLIRYEYRCHAHNCSRGRFLTF